MRLEDALRDALAELGGGNLERQLEHDPVEAVDRLADAYGGNAGLAVELAGTRDKGSREYKAALRSVERYRQRDPSKQQRDPRRSPTTMGRLGRLARGLQRQRGSDAPTTATAQGDIGIPHGGAGYTRYRTTATDFGPEDLDDVWDAYVAGDWDRMADAFEDAFADSYGVAGIEFEELDGLSFGGAE